MISSTWRKHLLWSLGCLLAFGLTVTAAPPNQAKAKADEPKKPLYDPQADTQTQVRGAAAKAKRDQARVLVMFGFEGCSWCHRLHALFEQNAEIRKLLRDEYVKMMVDIHAPHADELLKECKAALAAQDLQKGVGYPFLAVLDGDGRVVTAQRTEPLEEGKGHEPARVKEFLGRWIAPRADARAVLEAALEQAAKDDKRVFLHFGAPWCGWCHQLDDFLARPDVAAILSPDFVDTKIDTDRMTSGKDVLATYRKGKSGGIPWFVILDAKGTALATSDGPKGNIGYPGELHEIEHFVVMLKQAARKIEPAQIDRVEAALHKARTDLGLDRRR